MKHIMLDLETMGTIPGCAGFSIGAVVMNFEDIKLEEEFYTIISLTDSLENWLTEEPSTREWWDKQSAEARRALDAANLPEAPRLADAMNSLNEWFSSIDATVGKTRLYGNGADFDNPILRVMYDAAGVLPFNSAAGFYGGRCYRTLKNLDELFGPEFKATKMERSGTHHNALDDAKSQALHLMEFVRSVREATAQKEL